MGDRANIFIRDQFESADRQVGTWLYTHWRGYDVAERVRRALALRERWGDASYLARIVFQWIVDGDDGTTGFGISARPGDNERPVLVLDCNAQVVAVCDLGRDDQRRLGEPLRSMPFAQFAALDDDGARRFHLGDEVEGDEVEGDEARRILTEILFDEGDPPSARVRAVAEAALEAALAIELDAATTEEILREASVFTARRLGARATIG